MAESIEFISKAWPVILGVIIFVTGYATLRSDVSRNREDIKKVNNILTSGSSGTAPFITENEHDRHVNSCQSQIDSRIQGIEEDIDDMKNLMKEGDECRREAREETNAQFLAMRGETKSFYDKIESLLIPIIKQSAVNDSEIKNIKEKVNGK